MSKPKVEKRIEKNQEKSEVQDEDIVGKNRSKRSLGKRSLPNDHEDEHDQEVHANGKQKQQQMQKATMDMKKQQKHKQVQILAADTYCRLLAQIEALFKKLKIKVPARFAEFDLNDSSSDVQGLMMGVEGFLTSLRIYNISVQKQQLDPLEYPARKKLKEITADFRKGLEAIPSQHNTVRRVLEHTINCLENNSFEEGLPQVLSEAIMDDSEKAAHLEVHTVEGRTRMLGAHSDALSLTSMLDVKMKKCKDFDADVIPEPLADDRDMHDIKVRHYKTKDAFL